MHRLTTVVLALALLGSASTAAARPVTVHPSPVHPAGGYHVRAQMTRSGSLSHSTCPTSSGDIRYSTPRSKTVALTFDDGPSPKYTAQILAVLEANHVKATFFLVGQHVRMYPKQAQAIAGAGMWIGNHTYHHPQYVNDHDPRMTHTPLGTFDHLARSTQAREIDSTTKLITATTGVRPCWFRGPGGAQQAGVTSRLLAQRRLDNVYWSASTGDSGQPHRLSRTFQDKAVARATTRSSSAHPIVLMHENEGRQVIGYAFRGNTPKALDRIIKYYKARGFTFVSPNGWTR